MSDDFETTGMKFKCTMSFSIPHVRVARPVALWRALGAVCRGDFPHARFWLRTARRGYHLATAGVTYNAAS